MYQSTEQAEQDVARMSGWRNPRVVVDPEPDIVGQEIIYIVAEDEYGRRVVFDSPYESEPERLIAGQDYV